jgi:hypothetical protein
LVQTYQNRFVLAVAKDKYEANFTLKLRIRKDTLNLSAVQINDLKFRDRYIQKSTPLATVENSNKLAQQSKKLQFLYYRIR